MPPCEFGKQYRYNHRMWCEVLVFYHLDHVSVSPTNGIGPTRGQTKTLTKVREKLWPGWEKIAIPHHSLGLNKSRSIPHTISTNRHIFPFYAGTPRLPLRAIITRLQCQLTISGHPINSINQRPACQHRGSCNCIGVTNRMSFTRRWSWFLTLNWFMVSLSPAGHWCTQEIAKHERSVRATWSDSQAPLYLLKGLETSQGHLYLERHSR